MAGPDLYCITDVGLAGLPHEEQIAAMIQGGAPVIQLRDKAMPDPEFAATARRCLALCRAGGARLIVNDRARIAAEIEADGVHLGQDDMTPAEARALLGADSIIGLSTHSLGQFRRALEEPLDYIALGPVFPTTTKQNAEPAVGLEVVAQAAELLRPIGLPLVVIGGITEERVPVVRAAAPEALIAMIGAVVAGGEIADRVRRLRDLIAGGRT